MSFLYRRRGWLAAGHALAALGLLAGMPVPRLQPAKIPEQQLLQLTLEDLPEEPPPPPPKPPEPIPPKPPVPEPPKPVVPPKPVAAPSPPKPAPPVRPQPALAANAVQQVEAPAAVQPVQDNRAQDSQARPAEAAPAAPPVPAGPPAKTPEEVYVGALHQYLETIKRYPTSREARLERPSGETTVWFVLDRQGGLVDAGIEHGSGSMLLDQAALSTVRRGEYRAFPAELWPGKAEHRFIARLNFTLER